MPFSQSDQIRYYQFESLNLPGLKHAVFTRQGGVSPTPWASLNVGGTVGDETSRVIENRRRSFQAMDLPTESMYDVWQVHSAEVVCAQGPRPLDTRHKQADAILTDRPNVVLFMRFADCVPILLYDPLRHVVGLVHAGWQGTVKKVAAAAVDQLRQTYHSNPADILAAIGPSIGAHHYEVGEEVASQVIAAFGEQADTLLLNGRHAHNGLDARVQFDLWTANRMVLEQAGVQQIEVSGLCTACDLSDWFSHRGEKGRTGRFGALIGLNG